MKATNYLETIRGHLRAGGNIWLFLDYDGTLVPIARTPDEARPDAPLLELLGDLAQRPRIRVVVLSGRALASLQTILPVAGITLAGIYGVQIQMPGSSVVTRTEPRWIRPRIARVKRAWSALVSRRNGFLVEDKDLAIALHARFANATDAEWVLRRAKETAVQMLPADQFRILGGERFLEVAPAAANKGQTVDWLLNREPSFSALTVYWGDDDKDEEAFAVIRRRGGIPVVVGARQDVTKALVRVPSVDAVRRWLRLLQKAALASHRPHTVHPS